MSGIHMALMAGAGTSIRAGVNGTHSGYRHSDIAFPCGNRLPITADINGVGPLALSHDTSTGLMTVSVSGTYAQDFFTAIVINGQRLATADATFSAVFGVTFWQWAGSAFTDGVLYPFSYTP